MTTAFAISPGECDIWQLDCTELLEHAGNDVTISGVQFTVTTGSVTIVQNDSARLPRIAGAQVNFWADASASPAGDTTRVVVRLSLSSGSVIPRTVQFYTRVQ